MDKFSSPSPTISKLNANKNQFWVPTSMTSKAMLPSNTLETNCNRKVLSIPKTISTNTKIRLEWTLGARLKMPNWIGWQPWKRIWVTTNISKNLKITLLQSTGNPKRRTRLPSRRTQSTLPRKMNSRRRNWLFQRLNCLTWLQRRGQCWLRKTRPLTTSRKAYCLTCNPLKTKTSRKSTMNISNKIIAIQTILKIKTMLKGMKKKVFKTT